MRPKKITVSGVATSAWIPVDYKQAPFALGVSTVVSATATYTVEITSDDIFDTAVVPVAFPLATITGATTNQTSAVSAPVRAVRLNVAASTGTVSMTLIQGLR